MLHQEDYLFWYLCGGSGGKSLVNLFFHGTHLLVAKANCEALESVVGDSNSLDGNLQAAQVETEWAEVDSLIKELEQIKGVESEKKRYTWLTWLRINTSCLLE